MKRRNFLWLVSTTGAALATGGVRKALLARERVASVTVGSRGDRQWLHGKPGACAFAWGQRLKWSGYTLEQLLT